MLRVFRGIRRGVYKRGSVQLVVAEVYLTFGILYFIINILKDYWNVDFFAFLLWTLAGLALRGLEHADEELVQEPDELPAAAVDG